MKTLYYTRPDVVRVNQNSNRWWPELAGPLRVWWNDLRGSFSILAYSPMLCRTGLEKSTHRSILVIMAGKWLEIAQKMAQAARAGLAIERKRLNEILAERQQKQLPPSSQSSR